ncbi:hypothetical protein GCM10027024_15440 [Microbacterium insulae]
MRAVIETATKSLYYNVRLNASPGVLTTYCVNANGADACPWWVDTAFANGNRPPGTTAGAATATAGAEHDQLFSAAYTQSLASD